MPVESNHDEPLLRHLEAFGQTLEADSGQNLRPVGLEHQLGPDESSHVLVDQVGSTSGSHSRSRLVRRWRVAAAVAAAAALVVVASVGFTRLRTQNEIANDPSPEDPKEPAVFVSRGPSQIVAANGENVASVGYAEGQAFLDMDAGDQGENKINLAYVEQVFEELKSDDALWEAVDVTTATKEQWMGQAGLRIQTNLDLDIQKSAEAASLETEAGLNGVDTQVITVEPQTGAVVAFYGVGFEETEEGPRPIKRQPGSAFLPIVVAEAFEQGYTFSDEISGASPCAFSLDGQDDPYIANGLSLDGPITIQKVVAENPVCSAIRLGYVVGAEEAAAQAQNLGIESPIEAFPSLPLGTQEVAPSELVGAYNVFANAGQYVKPWYVSEVSADNVELFTRRAVGSQVVSVETAAMVNQTLIEAAENGTGRFEAKMDDRPSAGKTGSNQALWDAWYVGYTPQYLTGVWIGGRPGGENPAPATSEFLGGRYPAALWNSHMTTIHEGLEVEVFSPGVEPSTSPQTIEVPEELPVPDR